MTTMPFQQTMVTEALTLSVATTASTDQDTSALSRSDLVLAGRSEPADWSVGARQEIANLSALNENWDSYGGRAINPESIAWALAIADHLARIVGVTQPTVTATGEGLVAFCWDTGDWSLDASIDELGIIRYVFLDERDDSKDREGTTRNITELASLATTW